MRLRRGLSLLASTVILLPILPVAPALADAGCPVASTPSGAGTSTDPYLLGSPAELQWFRDSGSASASYALTTDISMAGCTWSNGIGGFSGQLNGQGFTVDGLSIASSAPTVGFFDATTSAAVIENMGLTNISVLSTFNPTAASGFAGGLVGDGQGQVSNVFVTGTVTARYPGAVNSSATHAGGIVGRLSNATITGSWFSGSVSGGGYSGGLVGYLFGGVVQGSFTTGSASGSYAGGIAGRSANTSRSADTAESYSSMDVSGYGAGGLVGRLGGRVLRSQSSGNVLASTEAGGIAGAIDSPVSVYDSFARGNVTASNSSGLCFAGGLLGRPLASRPTVQIARSFALGVVSNSSGHNCNSATYLGPLIPSVIPAGKIVQASFYIHEVTGGNNSAGTKATPAELQDLATYSAALPTWQDTSSGAFPIASVADCSQVSSTHLSLCPANDPYLSAIGLLNAPDAPTSVAGTGIDGGVEVSWSAPASDGGSAIVGYAIETSVDNVDWTTAVADTRSLATTAEVTGLTDGITYYFRVSALNAAGTSSPSTASSGVVAGALPSAPLNVVVSGVRSTETDLTWDPPAVSGASPIRDYRIEYSIGNSERWSVYADTVSATTSLTITGLTNGAIYRFRVSAENSLGWSAASTPTPEQYVGDVPEAPTDLRIVAWSRTGTGIGWQTPAAGSAPITGYQVEYSADAGSTWTTFPTTFASSATYGLLDGLTENQEYQFRVVATNAAGPSNPSTTITHVVGLIPTNPRNVTASSPDASTVRLQWDPPSDPGSSAVVAYRIDYSDDAGESWATRVALWPASSGTDVGLSGLPGGETYLFRVYASNRSGESSMFGQSGSVAIGTPTSAPTSVTAAASSGSASVTWQAPSATGTFAITGYAIQRSADDGSNWTTIATDTESTRTSYDDSGLTNGIAYRYRIAAVNAAGTSPFSSASTAVTPTSTSDFVSTWVVESNGGAITLPLTTGAGTSYDFTVAWGDGTSDRITAADLPATHTYASAGTYSVRISGTMAGWSFDQVPTSATAIADITQWGSFTPASGITGVFHGASDLDVSASDAPDLSATTTLDDFFRDATSLTTPDLSGWDTSGITSMNGVFRGASSFDSDLSAWDASSVTDMGDFLTGAQMDASNYQALLVSLANQAVQPHVAFSGGSSTWQAGRASGDARAVLTDTYGWTISDGGGTPSAPTITSSVPSSGQIGLEWTAPTQDGGWTITDYEYSVDSGAWTSFGSPATSGTITDLTDGTSYDLRIRAVNSVGAGVASGPASETPGSLAPAAPSSLAVTRGDQQLTVDFVVTYDGGSAIAGVEYSTNGGSTWAPTTSWINASGTAYRATITGLSNGTTYTLILRVQNGSQTSPPSTGVSGTPATTPGQPVITVTTGDGSMTVAANGAQDDGGLPIDRYEYRLESGTWVSTAALPFSVTGLAPGTYTIDVRAVTAVGTGPAATETAAVNVAAPGDVVGLLLTPGDGQISASWDPASGDVTDYEYSMDSGPWTSLGSTATSVVLTGLTNGTRYSVQVRAVNQGVSGMASPMEQSTPGVPAQVTGLTAVAGEERVTLSWTAPDPGASPITDYEYSLDYGSSWTSTGSSTARAEVGGLTAGLSITAVVRAVNVFGAGPASSGAGATPLPIGGGSATGIPGAPQDFTIAPLATGAELSWSAPADPGSTPITEYVIGYYPAENPAQPTTVSVGDGSTRSYTATGLTAGVEYTFMLLAINDAGYGPSTSANVTVGDLPGEVRDLAAEPGNSAVTLSWTAASPGGSSIIDYEYTINAGADWAPLGTDGTSATVTGLTNGTDYLFAIRARNESGAGPASDPVAQRAGVPLAPTGLQATVTTDAVELQWMESDAHGLGVTGYEITVAEAVGASMTMRSVTVGKQMVRTRTPRSSTYTTTSTSYTITGLSPTGSYRISVRAENAYGTGSPAITTVGLLPIADEEWVGPAPVVQEFGAPIDATSEMCARVAPADLDWAGVPSGGWGVSWAQWANDGRGGSVCTRTLVYVRWQARWLLAA